MTILERASALAAAQQGPVEGETLRALLEQAIRDGVRDAADELEALARRKLEIYDDLGMSGEDQARPIRDMAAKLIRRAEL